MKIDLKKGINLRVEGELGKFNTLPVETIVKMAKNLQELLRAIAQNDVDSIAPIHLENFNIELSGFKQGSAVPQFVFTPRIQESTGDVEKQRDIVNSKFEDLMKISNDSKYSEIRLMYLDANRRNLIVEKLYEFTNSWGSAPVTIVHYEDENKVIPIFRINRLKAETRNELVTPVIDEKKIKIEEYGVATIKVTTDGKGKTKRVIDQFFKKNAATLSYSPDVIIFEDIIYNLAYPLRSSLVKEDNYFVIQNEMLDIIGTGETEDDAEKNFAEEFNYIYKRYNELQDANLSDRIKVIKSFLNNLVKNIE